MVIWLTCGMVYIVGAGPGDPELITLKALNIIKKADVILYDRLIPKKLLEYCKKNAELIYIGKERGKQRYTQDEINYLMLSKAREGKIVVRLKGGDPYIFGRGVEEVLYLCKHGIKCEVVPGASSITAVPVYAGIPLTYRYLSSSFAVVTGQEAGDKDRKRVDIKSIACAVDTLVILMGVKNLRAIIDELTQVLPYDKPIAIIVNGTTPKQKVIVGTLANIIDKAVKENVEPPAIIIVGDVVKLRDQLVMNKG